MDHDAQHPSLPADEVPDYAALLEEAEAELSRREQRLYRLRGYFAWRIPLLVGVWYLTRGTPIHRFAILFFVVAVAVDYLIAQLRVNSAEQYRDALSERLLGGGFE